MNQPTSLNSSQSWAAGMTGDGTNTKLANLSPQIQRQINDHD